MTKRKRTDYTKRPWSPWVKLPARDAALGALFIGDAEPPAVEYTNSRYHVAAWFDGDRQHPMGEWVHLSIKDHGRSARHDWRDLQRIKNELVGPEFEAIEIYPAESRLVDTCNQYHLFVFKTWKPPQGFRERLVADGQSSFAPKAEQRPFEDRPADCLDGEQFDAYVQITLARSTTRT